MDIIDRINLCLAEIGKTGAEMSRDLGLSNSAYSQWNTHKYHPSKKTLAKIAPYLKTTVEYLLTGKKEPATYGDGLAEDEKEIIRLFRTVSPETRTAMLHLLRSAEAVRSTPGDGVAKI